MTLKNIRDAADCSARTPDVFANRSGKDSFPFARSLEILDKMPIQFTCNCTKSRVEKALISIGGRELQEMIDEGKSIEVNCQFCNKHYEFSVDELKKLYEKAKK